MRSRRGGADPGDGEERAGGRGDGPDLISAILQRSLRVARNVRYARRNERPVTRHRRGPVRCAPESIRSKGR